MLGKRHSCHCSPSLLSVLVLLCVPDVWAQAQPCDVESLFGTAIQPNTAFPQRFLAVTDLNADEVPDILASASGLAVLLGIPGGGSTPQFAAPAFYSTGPDPTGIAVSDFNHDGALDVAVASDGGGVWIFRGQLTPEGNPTGIFAAGSPLSLGSCWDVEAEDINRDGWTDLMVALRSGSVRVMFGSPPAGDGSIVFVPGTTSASGGSSKGLELVDFDGDQVLDVVVAHEAPSVGLLRGNGTGGTGDGTFQDPIVIPTAGGTYDVAVADFNRDGRPDFVSANYGGGSVGVYVNQGGFTFQPQTFQTIGSPLGIAVADIDLDGIDDVVTAATGSGKTFALMLGNGSNEVWNGSFAQAVGFGLRSAYGVTLADLDENGGMDVLAPIYLSSTLDLFMNSCAQGIPITLNVHIVGGGTVTRSPDLEVYPAGTEVTLSATPDAHYSFINWSGALNSLSNPETITMTRAKSVTATFAIDQFAVSVSTGGAGTGTIARIPDLPQYPYGSTVRLTALPALASTFDSWSGDASGNTNPLDLYVDGPKTIVGTFAPDTLIPPGIVSIDDVPLDEGGRVKIRWRASSWDQPPGDPLSFVKKYVVWREVPPTMAFVRSMVDESGSRLLRTKSAGQDFFWEYVTTFPASAFAGYSYTAETTSDSTGAGNPYTRFLIQARNQNDTQWWDSAPDSGYSVDNLAPPIPLPFTGTYGAINALHWTPNRALDFHEFRLYRGANADFVPGPGNFLLATRDTGYVDTDGGPLAYKLVAVDVHDNVSRVATVSSDLPVATLASVASVETGPDRIVIRWYAGGHAGVEAIIYRRTETQDWGEVAAFSFDGQGMLRYEDNDVVTGLRYGYVLGIPDAGEIVRAGEAWATAEAPSITFLGAWPNPALAGEMRVRFSLPGSGPARIHLLDIAGRRIHSREVGALGAGPHEIGIGDGAPLPAGIYLLRFESGALVRTQRIALLN